VQQGNAEDLAKTDQEYLEFWLRGLRVLDERRKGTDLVEGGSREKAWSKPWMAPTLSRIH